jgi:hypothetical protein
MPVLAHTVPRYVEVVMLSLRCLFPDVALEESVPCISNTPCDL